MSLTLAETITAETLEFSVTGTLTDDQVPGYEFGLDDELLTLRDFGDAPITTPIEDRRFVGRDRHRWIVTRGDVPASHTSGATVRGATDAFTRSSNADVPPPFANGGGATPTLAQVLAQGNDTGGIGIVSDATGSDTADASTTATSVDGNATATTTATTSGTGNADATVTASAETIGGDQITSRVTILAGDADAAVNIGTQIIATGASGNINNELSAGSVYMAQLGVGATDDAVDGHRTMQAAGSGTADASTTATSVDGNATATTTATASGTGSADASSTATAAGGTAGVIVQASSGSTTTSMNALGVGGPGAFVSLQSGGQVQINAAEPVTNFLLDDLSIGAGFGVQSTSTVGDTSAAPAVVASIAANSTGQVKLAVVAANAATTNPEIQINDLPLITTGSGAPGGTFLSLIYVDTTAVTGGGYCWDFVSGAYIKIGTV